MSEKPILFTPENAQKCHDGIKTMTRRILKPQPHDDVEWFGEMGSSNPDQDALWFPMKGYAKDSNCWEQASGPTIRCPYGTVGDRMWVREAYCKLDDDTNDVLYRGQCEEYRSLRPIWKPSIHMPKWACRTWLELTGVRVERLWAISYDDEGAEGIVLSESCNDRHSGFIALWESINGPGSWNLNPWVWVIAYRKVQP